MQAHMASQHEGHSIELDHGQRVKSMELDSAQRAFDNSNHQAQAPEVGRSTPQNLTEGANPQQSDY